MVSVIIVLILFLSKLIGINLIYNLLFLPFLVYLFLFNESTLLTRYNSAKIFLIVLIPISIIFILLSNGEESIYFILFRACSLSLFYLMLFGLLPFNPKLFEFLKYPLLLSLPAILFIFNPPFFYRYSSSGSSYIGSHGLFNAFSLSGLFPTSLYLAKLLTAYLLFFNNFPNISKKYLFIPFLSQSLNKFFAFILLIFTNRKAYLFAFIIYPLTNIFNTLLKYISSFDLSYKLFSRLIITFFIFFTGYFILQFGVGGGDYDYQKIFSELSERLVFYSKFAISPDNFTFSETGIMMINKLGGYYLYLFTYFILICSIINSIIKFKIKNLRIFLLSYTFILLFLFKEPHTIFSPSPSSLLLFMILSYFMRRLHFEEKSNF